MTEKRPLTSEEISALVNRIADEFASEDRAEVEMLAKMPPGERWLVPYRKAEAIRADLRNERTPPQADGVSSAKAIEHLLSLLTPQSAGY